MIITISIPLWYDYYGTIKSCVTPYEQDAEKVFQFHYGRLKVFQPLPFLVLHCYFNSTMVRLKDQAAEGEIPTITFQFHYGTIKRGNQKAAQGACYYISIPLWYD